MCKYKKRVITTKILLTALPQDAIHRQNTALVSYARIESKTRVSAGRMAV